VVEVGMAYGVSALTILTALQENGTGQLISIDPYPKWESARETALNYIHLSGLSGLHRHIHAPSEIVLPKLYDDGVKAQFVYIDGHHGFDHAFIDFFYSDLLLDIGGVIAFDDSAWRSVHKVIRYLNSHREYEEIDVGLKKLYAGRNPLGTLARRLQGRFGSTRYFSKRSDFAPPYNFYKRF
jgi:predicted O-methyltransferase YrrM